MIDRETTVGRVAKQQGRYLPDVRKELNAQVDAGILTCVERNYRYKPAPPPRTVTPYDMDRVMLAMRYHERDTSITVRDLAITARLDDDTAREAVNELVCQGRLRNVYNPITDRWVIAPATPVTIADVLGLDQEELA